VEPQHVFVSLIIVVLLGLAGYYAWQQVQTLRLLRLQENLPPEDRSYMRNQAWRRLACCALMVLLAILLIGTFVLGLEAQAERLGAQVAEDRAHGQEMKLNAEQKRFVNLYTYCWITILLVLLSLLGLAASDLWAIHRFGLRHHRQIQADRRAMLERQVARMRTERNGHG